MIFEWLCGGGLWIDQIEPDENCPMQKQGKQMLSAVADDLLNGEIETCLIVDQRMADQFPDYPDFLTKKLVNDRSDLKEVIASAAWDADQVLIIAPESEGILANCLTWLNPNSPKLVSPDLAFVELTANKLSTCRYLSEKGFTQHPNGTELTTFLKSNEPASLREMDLVIKPITGAGSESTWTSSHPELIKNLSKIAPDEFMVENLISGTPMSVSALCGGGKFELLPPTIQQFDHSPIGHYVGTGWPVAENLSDRATALAQEVMNLLPDTQGYIGLDLVIGEEGDFFIEANPRLTMSYVKLSEIVEGNLGMRMLNFATGNRA